jgi:hypothetical protein
MFAHLILRVWWTECEPDGSDEDGQDSSVHSDDGMEEQAEEQQGSGEGDSEPRAKRHRHGAWHLNCMRQWQAPYSGFTWLE